MFIEELLKKYIEIEKANGKTDEEIDSTITKGLERLENILVVKGEQIV
jgi:hypothetical protein